MIYAIIALAVAFLILASYVVVNVDDLRDRVRQKDPHSQAYYLFDSRIKTLEARGHKAMTLPELKAAIPEWAFENFYSDYGHYDVHVLTSAVYGVLGDEKTAAQIALGVLCTSNRSSTYFRVVAGEQ